MILHVLIAMVGGWIPQHQRRVITYLQEENRVLTPSRTAAGCDDPHTCHHRRAAGVLGATRGERPWRRRCAR